MLSNYWEQSLDYANRPPRERARRTHASDGSVRIIVAHRDPGARQRELAHTAGHCAGVWQFRWLAAEGDVEIPTPRLSNGKPLPIDRIRVDPEKSREVVAHDREHLVLRESAD